MVTRYLMYIKADARATRSCRSSDCTALSVSIAWYLQGYWGRVYALIAMADTGSTGFGIGGGV